MRTPHLALSVVVLAAPTTLVGQLTERERPLAPVSVRATDHIPNGLSRHDWTGIRKAYEAERHAVRAVVDGSKRIYRAYNPRQRWRTHFDGRGSLTSPDDARWAWGLTLVRYGFLGEERDVTKPLRVRVDGGRIGYAWDESLEEWYVNDSRGLEHGFTIDRRPSRVAHSTPRPLMLTLAVRGDLRPEVAANEREVFFLDGRNALALTYSGLHVFDAAGRTLPARFERSGDRLCLRIEESDARYPLTIDPIAQRAYFKASNTDLNDFFGYAVAISGDTAVVGARGEDSNATGINGDQSDNSAYDSGAAYVFVRSGITWSQQAYLKASNTEWFDYFGFAVAISGDAIVVGARSEDSDATGVNGDQNNNSAPSSGAAYVFVRSSGSWSQVAYLKASNTMSSALFGSSVGVSGDTVVVGAVDESTAALRAGAAYVFRGSGSSFRQEAFLQASNADAGDNFGHTVAAAGDRVVVGAYFESSDATGVGGDQGNNNARGSGAAYVFSRSGSWSQEAYLKASNTEASDRFGWSVAISGNTVVVGAEWEDSSATGIDGDQSNNGAKDSGAAYVFLFSNSIWKQQAYLKASNTDAGDEFGWSVAVSENTASVGAPFEDSSATGVDGNQADNSANDAGAVYVFLRSGTNWQQQYYLKASNTEARDEFGRSVAVSEETTVVGAPYEDSNATGVDGNSSNNGLTNSGAAYAFHCKVPCATVSPVGTGCVAIGQPPVLAGGRPVVGGSLTWSIVGGPRLKAGVMLWGAPHPGIALGRGCEVFVDLALPTIPLGFVTNTAGSWLPPPVPVSSVLLGVVVATQAGIDEPATPPIALALTNALWLKVGY